MFHPWQLDDSLRKKWQTDFEGVVWKSFHIIWDSLIIMIQNLTELGVSKKLGNPMDFQWFAYVFYLFCYMIKTGVLCGSMVTPHGFPGAQEGETAARHDGQLGNSQWTPGRWRGTWLSRLVSRWQPPIQEYNTDLYEFMAIICNCLNIRCNPDVWPRWSCRRVAFFHMSMW